MPNTVLIVDDSAAMRHALHRLFEAAGGFSVCGEACDGMEAIEMVRKLEPQLIVLDLCMPGISGMETAHRLQSVKQPPMIILYGLDAEGILPEEAFRNGVNEIASKVEGVKTLINKARRVLHRSAA